MLVSISIGVGRCDRRTDGILAVEYVDLSKSDMYDTWHAELSAQRDVIECVEDYLRDGKGDHKFEGNSHVPTSI